MTSRRYLPPTTSSPVAYTDDKLTAQIVTTDDYMPMPINSLDEYDKVINVSWYTPETARENLT